MFCCWLDVRGLRESLESLYPTGLRVVFARGFGGAQGGDGVRVKLGHVWGWCRDQMCSGKDSGTLGIRGDKSEL